MTDWRDHAQCLGTDPETMQPEVATPEQVRDAESVCTGCPVLSDCLQWARSQDEPYGVHAGRWFGDPPRRPEVTACQWCGDEFPAEGSARRRYCSDAHRMAARRAEARARALSA